jgi:hypothetical protein
MKQEMKSGSSMKACQCADDLNVAAGQALHNSVGVLYTAAKATGAKLNPAHPDKVALMGNKSY